MRKIFVDKSEPVAAVVEKLISEPDPELVVVIPRDAKVGESVGNFHLIKREADATGKNVLIESVDEEVLALAKAAKLNASHPLFSAGRSKSLSDIVPVAGGEKGKAPKRKAAGRKPRAPAIEPELLPEAIREEEVEEVVVGEPQEIAAEKTGKLERRKNPPRRTLIALLALVVIAGGAWAASVFFARAEIRINFNETPWEYRGQVLATKTASEISPAAISVPAEVFRDRKNLTQFFPATGKAQVSEKAKGRLTIYNAYSSQPQTLVATTRFAAPDGKIFRLDNQVVVPGAQIKDGKIIPASIETGVTADKAGADYNLGRVDKLTIPGFKGTPKYEGFYGALPQGASSGFVGEKTVPTDADITSAKDKITQVLKASLENNLLSGRPAEFKILDGTARTEVTRTTVNKSVDDRGNFSITGEAEFQAIGFRESDVKSLLLALVRKSSPDADFKRLEISYADAKPDYERGEMRFTLTAQGELTAAFDQNAFVSQAAGQEINAVRGMILKLPRLGSAEVSVWPIWLSRLPADTARITVTLE